jgi:hypothetical protein
MNGNTSSDQSRRDLAITRRASQLAGRRDRAPDASDLLRLAAQKRAPAERLRERRPDLAIVFLEHRPSVPGRRASTLAVAVGPCAETIAALPGAGQGELRRVGDLVFVAIDPSRLDELARALSAIGRTLARVVDTIDEGLAAAIERARLDAIRQRERGQA